MEGETPASREFTQCAPERNGCRPSEMGLSPKDGTVATVPLGSTTRESRPSANHPSLIMYSIPQRDSLVSKTAETIRHLLAVREWVDHLPAERVLSQRLQISRSTLRKALLALEREGLIEILHGHGSRIAQRPQPPGPRSTIVGVLREGLPWEVSNLSSYLTAELEHHLHLAGLEMRVFTDQLAFCRRGPGRITSYTRQVNAACWILFYPNRNTQQWFAHQGIPALIVGHRFPAVPLPFIDINHEATCRHATGKLLGMGHRRIALLLPDNQEASLLARESGFRRAFEARKESGAVPLVVTHDKSIPGIGRTLDAIFRKPVHPTALIVADAWHVLTAVSHLGTSGWRVPQDVAVVSTDFELFLRANIPQVAAYVINPENFAARLSRLAIQLAKTGNLTARPHWIIPRFRPGASIGTGARLTSRHQGL